jgi:hypothetical protein
MPQQKDARNDSSVSESPELMRIKLTIKPLYSYPPPLIGSSSVGTTVSIPSTSGQWFIGWKCFSTVSILSTSTILLLIIFISSCRNRWFIGWSCSLTIFILFTSDISIPSTSTYLLRRWWQLGWRGEYLSYNSNFLYDEETKWVDSRRREKIDTSQFHYFVVLHLTTMLYLQIRFLSSCLINAFHRLH